MKKFWFMLCGAALMLLVVAVFAADKKAPAPADLNAKMEALTKQLDSLQAKNKELEQRLAKLESRKLGPVFSGGPITTMPNLIVPRVIQNNDLLRDNFADPNHPPKIWGEGECNGWKYYTIPLSATAGEAAMPIPLAAR